MKKAQESFFRTSDIALSSTLQCLGFKITEIIKDDSGKAVFVLNKTKRLQSILDKYFSDELQLSPVQFFDTLKRLKTRIYNIR